MDVSKQRAVTRRAFARLALLGSAAALLSACAPAATPAPTAAPPAKPTEAPPAAKAAAGQTPAAAAKPAEVAKPTAVAAAPAQPKTLTKGTIMFGGKSVVWSPAYVALDKGYFRDEGLDVEFTYAQQGAASAIAALVSREVIMAFLGGPDAMNAIGRRPPIRITMYAGDELTLEFTGSNAWLSKTGVTAQSPLQQRVNALKGAKIAIWTPGDTQSQLVNFLLKTYGARIEDVELIQTQNAANEFAAFQQGSVDIMVLSPPVGSQAEALGLGKIFMTAREVPELKGYPYLVGVAHTSDIQEKAAQVKGIIKAMARATQGLKKEPEALKASVQKEFSTTDPKAFDDAYKSMLTVLPATPVPTQKGFQTFVAFAKEAPTGAPDVTYEQAIDPSLAEQVTKELGL